MDYDSLCRGVSHTLQSTRTDKLMYSRAYAIRPYISCRQVFSSAVGVTSHRKFMNQQHPISVIQRIFYRIGQ